jgi:NAD(P)-dependent dehydrogenase (short-subunit alcohol dehydrogenase family)
VADAFRELGPVDVVVSNAGYGVFASAEEASGEQIRQVIDTNPLGSINVIRASGASRAPARRWPRRSPRSASS